MGGGHLNFRLGLLKEAARFEFVPLLVGERLLIERVFGFTQKAKLAIVSSVGLIQRVLKKCISSLRCRENPTASHLSLYAL